MLRIAENIRKYNGCLELPTARSMDEHILYKKQSQQPAEIYPEIKAGIVENIRRYIHEVKQWHYKNQSKSCGENRQEHSQCHGSMHRVLQTVVVAGTVRLRYGYGRAEGKANAEANHSGYYCGSSAYGCQSLLTDKSSHYHGV